MTKEAKKEYNKKWHAANRDKILAQKKEYRAANKDKILAKNKEYRAANKEEIKYQKKEYSLLKNYKITLNDYNILFNKQNGCCKICGVNELLLKGSLCVDHCHSTGKVRGLLCKACNLMIGNAKDDINTLNRAIIYLTP